MVAETKREEEDNLSQETEEGCREGEAGEGGITCCLQLLTV